MEKLLMSRICVIGSNSFSGASFCAHLLSQGKEVIGISRSAEPVGPLLPYAWQEHNKLQFHQLDLNQDLVKIKSLLNIHRVGEVYNFAALSMVGQSWQYPEHWFMTNIVSMVKLHNFLRQTDYLNRYVHISTPEVYGSCSGSVFENKNYQPSTPYSVSRAAADMSLHTFFDTYQFPVVFTRAVNVFGEGQQLYRIIPRAIMYILGRKKLQLHGGGGSERSFIHIDDVSVATQLIGERGANGDIYHISTEQTVTIKQLVALICDMMGYSFEELCEVSDDRLGKDQAYSLNSNKLRDSLGWSDSISLEQGIDRTITWVQEHYQSLCEQPENYIHKQ